MGAVTQISNPDAIYSRYEKKKKGACGYPVFLGLAHGSRVFGGRSVTRKEATRSAAQSHDLGLSLLHVFRTLSDDYVTYNTG